MLAIDKGYIARWKIDNKFENWLSYKADKSELAKKAYCAFYKIFDRKYYKTGLEFAKKEIASKNIKTAMSEKQLLRDMIYSLHRFGCRFDEYFAFKFYDKNYIGREKYITDKIRYEYWCMMDSHEDSKILADKARTCELFGEFFKRGFVFIETESDREKFVEFAGKHEKFICKMCSGARGQGISIYNMKELDVTPDELFNEIIGRGTFVCEELIQQADSISKFHPSSVNTVRLPTVNCDDGIQIFCPLFRIGRGSSVVDNAGAGGIAAPIDEKTGIVVGCACSDFTEEVYALHPDTGEQIVGFQMPEWDKAIALVKETAALLPSVRFISWDLAYSDKGWVLVEGNELGQLIANQAARQRGIKDDFLKLMYKGKLNNK